jgi:hypothetical protein
MKTNYLQPRFFAYIIIILACAMLFPLRDAFSQTETVKIYGAAFSQSAALQQALQKIQIKPENITSVNDLNAGQTRLLILAGENALPVSSDLAISRFLQSGGNVIVIGTHNFYGAPQPVHEIPLGDLSQKNRYTIVKPDGGKSNGEDPQIQEATDPNGQPALRLTTFKRDMINIRIQFSAIATRSAKRTVVTFMAKGDAYMDLMYLEATDSTGQKYFSFVPLSHQWQKYAISLADFIPENWSDATKPYPLINPAKVETIALGTNRSTLWQEKPMDFSLGQVNLAEEKNDVYAPTAALNRLSVPFKEIGITAPQWIFDPFYESELSASSAFSAPGGKSTFTSKAWICPPAYADFPGTKMGTDTKKEYDTRQSHSMRRDVLFEIGDTQQPVAETRLLTGGIYAGSNVALFGFSPQQIVNEPVLLNALSQTINQILNQPRLAQIKINTTAQRDNSTIYPVLDVTVKNPLDHVVDAELTIKVGPGPLQGKAKITLPANSLSTQKIQLSQIPSGFNFAHFQWQVTLKSVAGVDSWQDTVDAERTLLQAIIHMANAQKIYPDGRISNHYFADAYGVRAMFAYLKFLEKHPEHLKLNPDLWKQITPQQIRESAERFGDMLVRRQNADGSVPMGYGEQSNNFNVADGGQISLGMGLIAFEEKDAARRQLYLQVCKKIIDFAETFYIDQQRFEQLQKEDANDIKKYRTHPGYYGLGVYGGGKRRNAGPIWVLSDLLTSQTLLSYAFPDGPYRKILERNIHVYLDHAGSTSGWYQSEAMIWCWLSLPDQQKRQRIADNLKSTFLPTLFTGEMDDMYDSGARGSLRALPLIYYRRYLGDSENERAALLKYVWAAGSETSSDSVASLAREYPNPHHGMSIAAMKFGEFSSIWAMELLDPGSTLLQMKEFPRVK